LKKYLKSFGIYIIIFALVLSLAWLYYGDQRELPTQVEFSKFITQLQNENIKTVTIVDTKITGTLRSTSKEIYSFSPTIIEGSIVFEKFILPQVEKGTLTVTSQAPVKTPWYITLLPTIFMVLLFVVFWFMFMQQGQGGGGKVMQFGKSRAKLHKEGDGVKITFADVAGLDEEKEELEEVVDFLKHPKKYIDLGARIPKGILLVGPPGTGKTYLSKAAAGEAGVPFFSISGSDFVEMFVGVGASRVRDLFEQAKKSSPCIIFIDEIDAVGRKRGAGLGGGHDEREQTLNQLLVEMDGFGLNEGIIILAATNRPDILDSALLRPGRFDRQIVIGIPDVKGREAIFNIHSKNKPLDKGVDGKVLARRTPGFTPADIENMLNEAAILTARHSEKKITMKTIEEAITKVIAGPEKKSRVISVKARRLTAFHEAGHAVVARLLENSDPVHQVTIIPRGLAGGFTMTLPKEDRSYLTKTEMQEQLIHLLGGRVAEKLVLHDISTGASNDLERATNIARAMVTKYGMSDKIGPINYSTSEEVFLGKDFSSKKNYSEEIAAEIDAEIKAFVENAFVRAEEILMANMDKLNLVAETLLEVETLNADQFEALFTAEKTKEEIVEDFQKEDAPKKKRARRVVQEVIDVPEMV
jgi:cell division protease FtsH